LKTFKVESNIGEGLFVDEAIAISLEFPDGSVETYELYALTQDKVIQLQKEGVSFKEHKDGAKAHEDAKKIIDKLVKSGTYKGEDISGNKHKIASNLGLMSAIVKAAGALAEEKEEEEEKNSES
jgi:hypothetical protein